MSLTMYDSIYVQNLEPPPPGAQAYAGYVDGNWPDYASIVSAYPSVPVLSIAVFASDDAECLDVETGDATIGQIYGWHTRQLARGVWRPCTYSSADNMNQVYSTMTANGFTRSSYRLWSAHYGAGEHVCGPSTCGLVSVDCDGTQWTDTVNGGKADESLLADDFFGTVQPPAQGLPSTSQEDASMILGRLGNPTPIAVADGQTRIRFCPVFGSVGTFPTAQLSVDFHVGGEHPVSVTVDPNAVLPVLDIPANVFGITVWRMDSDSHDVSAVVY